MTEAIHASGLASASTVSLTGMLFETLWMPVSVEYTARPELWRKRTFLPHQKEGQHYLKRSASNWVVYDLKTGGNRRVE